MKDTCICIYSHSSYKPIVDLMLYCLMRLNISVPIYIFRNTDIDFPVTPIIHKIVKYDDSLPYAQKLLSCTREIKEKYMILFQEKDMLLKYDEGRIGNIIDFMSTYDAATVDLHINQSLYNANQDDIMTADEKKMYPTNFRNPDFAKEACIHHKDIVLTKALDYHYSCGPRIWNVKALIHILEHFPNKTYRDIESHEVDSFMIHNRHYSFKLGQGKHDVFIFAGKGFKMLDYFAWLSVTNFRKIIDDRYWGDLRPDILKALSYINMTRESFLNIQLE